MVSVVPDCALSAAGIGTRSCWPATTPAGTVTENFLSGAGAGASSTASPRAAAAAAANFARSLAERRSHLREMARALRTSSAPSTRCRAALALVTTVARWCCLKHDQALSGAGLARMSARLTIVLPRPCDDKQRESASQLSQAGQTEGCGAWARCPALRGASRSTQTISSQRNPPLCAIAPPSAVPSLALADVSRLAQ